MFTLKKGEASSFCDVAISVTLLLLLQQTTKHSPDSCWSEMDSAGMLAHNVSHDYTGCLDCRRDPVHDSKTPLEHPQ